MTVKILFKTWTALKDILIDPSLSEHHMNLLVDQSMQIIVAMTNTPSTGLMDVLLKLDTYGREVEAGPCAECDALLASALRDRASLFGPLGAQGLAAAGWDEHRPRLLPEHETPYDPSPRYAFHRDKDTRSSHP
jgi:hypothetical protein